MFRKGDKVRSISNKKLQGIVVSNQQTAVVHVRPDGRKSSTSYLAGLWEKTGENIGIDFCRFCAEPTKPKPEGGFYAFCEKHRDAERKRRNAPIQASINHTEAALAILCARLAQSCKNMRERLIELGEPIPNETEQLLRELKFLDKNS